MQAYALEGSVTQVMRPDVSEEEDGIARRAVRRPVLQRAALVACWIIGTFLPPARFECLGERRAIVQVRGAGCADSLYFDVWALL